MDEALRVRARSTRAQIVAGTLRGAALRERLLSIPARERDVFVDVLLGSEELPSESADLPRGAVPYLPSGVDEILTLVDEAPVRSEDILVDVGAGLGRVLILAHLLSGARGVGVEVQAALVQSARATCSAFHLADISFVHSNAADVTLDGSIFYLYAPCNGELLTRVLGRVEAVARRRPIVVGAVGLELDGLSWLRRRETSCVSLTLYDSR